ncbi:hypothetical protein [Methylobacterium sp. J-068]|uniref:hypothetical protein n=1 Tax=Methylobacterium sp. J-068 TaxID=2836649 RepID=UPI001FBA5E93|nr:hypothetical protein [Methylobacterium sp. J-068]MCJ2033994.1 hypothetical protein [Methylobacterium sp. J-068]
MLASIVVTTVSLIALQVVLVMKVADWMSQDSGTAEGRNDVVVGSVNGRFAGIA